jgi:hypothetical protein
MVKKIYGYTIRVSSNYGNERRSYGRFTKKVDAQRELKKILSPAKVRQGTGYMKGKKIYLTSYRDAQSGTGLNNPRIKKIKIYR